jgi:2-polyprenyl-6-methoxyphenol hydroxylase-like FAD-dependent oxidoreductase
VSQSYQVVIVGGGPVGIALAVELGQRGVSCAVVERHLGVGRIPKGQNLTQRTLEHFYFWRCADQLRAARLLPPGYPIGGVTAYGNLMSEFWYPEKGREVVQSYYFQRNERLPQYLTEAVLRARASELPDVTFLFGWSARTVHQSDKGARVVIEAQGDASCEKILWADYVVGCDGARSLVRGQAGITRTGPDFDQRMVLAVFRSRELHEGLKRFPERTTYRVFRPENKGYWLFFGRVNVGEGWFFHAPAAQDASPEGADIHGLLQSAAGFPFSCEFDHIGFWDLRVEVASRYREGRVFIAGDACHSHPPYGGFGLNSGLEDVANLGWKLAAELEGWGTDRLLDSYSTERQPVFVETGQLIANRIGADAAFLERYSPTRDRAEFERAWRGLADNSGSVQSYEPYYEGSPVVWGPPGGACSVRGRHSFAARAGHHLAPQPLSTGRDVFQELGPGFTLLAFDAEQRSVAELDRVARSLGVPLTIVRDRYDGERERYEHRWILVRPDQYVAWAADDPPTDASGLLRRVVGSG